RGRPPRAHEICREAEVRCRRKLRRGYAYRSHPPVRSRRTGSRRRMIDIGRLSAPMAGDGCRAELFSELHRDPLRDACAEDRKIWEIYSLNFGPPDFDQTIDAFSGRSSNRTFVLFEGDEIAGMSSFISIDNGRQCVE